MSLGVGGAGEARDEAGREEVGGRGVGVAGAVERELDLDRGGGGGDAVDGGLKDLQQRQRGKARGAC